MRLEVTLLAHVVVLPRLVQHLCRRRGEAAPQTRTKTAQSSVAEHVCGEVCGSLTGGWVGWAWGGFAPRGRRCRAACRARALLGPVQAGRALARCDGGPPAAPDECSNCGCKSLGSWGAEPRTGLVGPPAGSACTSRSSSCAASNKNKTLEQNERVENKTL